ncbi:MAG: hypothetical protein ACT4PM_02040 [Gemmatimonadales bacterium]
MMPVGLCRAGLRATPTPRVSSATCSIATTPAVPPGARSISSWRSRRRDAGGPTIPKAPPGWRRTSRVSFISSSTVDGALLGEIRKYHRPPEEKLPPVIWSRLYFDLEPYLTLRKADGTNLFAFYHRQLEAVARERYLNPGRHRALAEYFTKRELFLGEQKTPNVRKLSELPYQQTYAGDLWEELYQTLTDFEFLEAKCTHVAVTEEGSGDQVRKVYGGVYELQEDYRRALEVFPG